MQGERFRHVVERYRNTVFRVAYTYMRDQADADDVAQDVFLKLLRTDKVFDSEDHLRNWLIRVTINRCKSLFRKPWRRVEDIETYAESLAMPTREHGELLVSLMCLPERYRVPLLLHYYLGYSTDETARLLHVLPATVRTRLSRGRARLRKMIEQENGRAAAVAGQGLQDAGEKSSHVVCASGKSEAGVTGAHRTKAIPAVSGGRQAKIPAHPNEALRLKRG